MFDIWKYFLIKNYNWAYSRLGYLKGWFNEKKIIHDYFQFLLYLLFHDYSELVYDYNYNDVVLI